MEDRTPRSSGETGGEKRRKRRKKREGEKGGGRQTREEEAAGSISRQWFDMLAYLTKIFDKNLSHMRQMTLNMKIDILNVIISHIHLSISLPLVVFAGEKELAVRLAAGKEMSVSRIAFLFFNQKGKIYIC